MTLPLPSGDTWARADYETLPEDLPVRVSLIHGERVVGPRPRPFHQRIARRLATRIEDAAPDAWQVDTDVDVLLDERVNGSALPVDGPAHLRAVAEGLA